MNVITSWDGLRKIVQTSNKLYLYGAGVRLRNFLTSLSEMEIQANVEAVIVTDKCGNPDYINKIPVIGLNDTDITNEDIILLTVCEYYINDICAKVAQKNEHANVYAIDFNIIDSVPALKILGRINSFVKGFPNTCMNLNTPIENEYTLWTCWWQGEENAPDIVKACWRSWDKYALKNVKRIVITEKNYKEYIEIPDYIIQKVNRGLILLAHLSDIIRVSLLYKYGGIWLDSTIFLNDVMPEECLCKEYDIFTRNIQSTEFGSKASWAIWFLCAKRGEKLFKFVMEAYFYYFREYDEVLYYLMTDYLFGIACNTFPDIVDKLNAVPLNNVRAMDVMKHLHDVYDKEKFTEYTKGGYLQKLSRHGKEYAYNSIYEYILNVE